MIASSLLRYRPLELAHLERWHAWINDAEIAALLDRVLPVTLEEHRTFYQQAVVQNRQAVWFALHTLADDRYIGNVWLWNINTRHRNAEVRIVIGERDVQGRGFGSEALAGIATYAHRQLGLHKVYAYVLGDNARGCAAFAKAGYVREATLCGEWLRDGVFCDVARYVNL